MRVRLEPSAVSAFDPCPPPTLDEPAVTGAPPERVRAAARRLVADITEATLRGLLNGKVVCAPQTAVAVGRWLRTGRSRAD